VKKKKIKKGEPFVKELKGSGGGGGTVVVVVGKVLT
jgi:hypothetical protein